MHNFNAFGMDRNKEMDFFAKMIIDS